ncbi:hypothetical protein F3Y22_tig00111540pilonHSYRG00104 [Hibiscus syriacus]|uniref:Potassium channel domain-containing protein n=1 Tax=Hibiscus syriacus TaxID=106335 RepID=A0A6A2XLM7_HIBSY|nr:hypothetical protein F3Y22_tig00111540pilonHSYRG00104 [Hibiscus syriacus]
MASNAAKQAKLPMAASGSPNLADDEMIPRENHWSCNAASVAGNIAIPNAIRTVLPDLKELGKYYGIYTSIEHYAFCWCAVFSSSRGDVVRNSSENSCQILGLQATSSAAQCPACGSENRTMEALKEIESLNIDYTKCMISLIAMGVHLVIGIFVLCTVEKMEYDDAFYCAFSTMTTVGFGDEIFSTLFGRMFGMIWIFTGTSCLGQLFSTWQRLYRY